MPVSTGVSSRHAFVLSLALALGACGFYPRGSGLALNDPGRLFLDTERGLSIEADLRDALAERAFVLAANRDEADIVLRVAGERQTRRIVSVRSTGRVSEFELGHGVTVALARNEARDGSWDDRSGESSDSSPDGSPNGSANGSPGSSSNEPPDESLDDVLPATNEEGPADVLPEQAVSQLADRVQVTREYTYDESQVLGKENEARILRGEMSDELVRQIVLRTVASLAQGETD